NVIDWQHSMLDLCWLPDDRTALWIVIYQQARSAQASGDFARLESLATELVALDQRTNAVSLQLLAECKLRNGAADDAYDLYGAAQEAALLIPSGVVSGVMPTTQATLRSYGPERGLTVVDLPLFFRRVLDGGLPDRRLFL